MVAMSHAAPPRPTPDEVAAEFADHVRMLAGPDAQPRHEQVAAVTAVAAEGRRTLLVARTGFGKSAVYFSMTRMLRDRGWGPTLVISPLLALMRDQVAAAERLGLSAATINSTNIDAWTEIEDALAADSIDLLLIAPERLANPGFRSRVSETLLSRPIPIVTDEAHCISDWGHDFRPDYRRLRSLIGALPKWTPVLATTATANGRVMADVAEQLGDDTLVLRTSLDRPALHLSVVDLEDEATRLAWIDRRLEGRSEPAIVYCLTQSQAERTAGWLTTRGFDAAAYSGATDPELRRSIEDRLQQGTIDAVAATSALGMGFDASHIGLCIHLGLPPSPIAYYQQIGRAGRALARADVVALPRPEIDPKIWTWFESVSLPAESTCREVLDHLSPDRAISIARLEPNVNLGRTRLQNLLAILEVEGAIRRVDGGWIRRREEWFYDEERIEGLRRLRAEEAGAMTAFAGLSGCRLRFLREQLDDLDPADCGRCDACLQASGEFPPGFDPSTELIAEARRHLEGGDIVVEPRRQWPSGLDEPKGRIPEVSRAKAGRALTRSGDSGWDDLVNALWSDQPADPEVRERIVAALAAVVDRWSPQPAPGWLACLPSRNQPLSDVAQSLAVDLSLPMAACFLDEPDRPRQDTMANSAHQVSNLWGRLRLDHGRLPNTHVRSKPVLLLDGEVGSRWTITVASHLLAQAGAGPVLPLALRIR